jgi:hypothetical protein
MVTKMKKMSGKLQRKSKDQKSKLTPRWMERKTKRKRRRRIKKDWVTLWMTLKSFSIIKKKKMKKLLNKPKSPNLLNNQQKLKKLKLPLSLSQSYQLHHSKSQRHPL